MKPQAIGAFCYAGGFTLGMRSRFAVRTHLEDPRPYGSEAAQDNLGVDVVAYHEDAWAEAEADKTCDVFYANPPCAPFSSAGMRLGRGAERWETDPRMWCHEASIAEGARRGADVVVLESVTAARTRALDFYRFHQPNGYALTFVDHDAARLGLTQRRRRTFVVYHRVALDELRVDGEDGTLEPGLLWDLRNPARSPAGGRESVRRLIQYTEPGEKLLKGWARAGSPRPGVPAAASRRLAWGETTPALAGTYGYAHPDEDRFLNLAEFQRLSGFPDDWVFKGSSNDRVLLMVRGVMPPVAARLAEALRGSLQNRPIHSKKLNEVVVVKT